MVAYFGDYAKYSSEWKGVEEGGGGDQIIHHYSRGKSNQIKAQTGGTRILPLYEQQIYSKRLERTQILLLKQYMKVSYCYVQVEQSLKFRTFFVYRRLFQNRI
jgi:hypothetical protein